MMEPVADDSTPERIWAGDFNGQGFGHCVAGMQGGLYEEYVLASRLSDAAARIATLEAALSDMTAKAERQWSGWVKAEALLKEAGDIIKRAQQNTPEHFSNWHEAARAIYHKIGVKDE